MPRVFRGKVKQRIFDYIRTHPGCDREQIIESVYGNDPSNRPETITVLSAHLVVMREQLKPLGLTIKAQTGHGGGNYRLEKLTK
jgi:hypothetical protein